MVGHLLESFEDFIATHLMRMPFPSDLDRWIAVEKEAFAEVDDSGAHLPIPSSGANLVECGPGCSRFEETGLLGAGGSADFDERLFGERGRFRVGEQVLGNAPDS